MIEKVLLLIEGSVDTSELHHASVRNNIAIHRTLFKNGDKLAAGYSISHKNSGLCLVRCKNLKTANKVANYLDTLDIKWETELSIRASDDFEKLKKVVRLFDVFAQRVTR